MATDNKMINGNIIYDIEKKTITTTNISEEHQIIVGLKITTLTLRQILSSWLIEMVCCFFLGALIIWGRLYLMPMRTDLFKSLLELYTDSIESVYPLTQQVDMYFLFYNTNT